MVQLGGFEKFRQTSNKVPPPPDMVKLEVEDQLEEEDGPFYKKMKKQWNDAEMVPPQSLHNSLLEEPSPLGLRLRKSPSLLDLIQARLSEEKPSSPRCDKSNLGPEARRRKDLKSSSVPVANEKLKASNFPASVLRIGSWERVSKYEDDLVAKCYYAKQKLVWEVLDGGLKSKIEIQWSDIAAIKATYPDNVPGTLDIVLARQPLFFREINPQPRKHTLWQATTDFTNGQATMHRRHFLQCPPGLLNKHFEKLIQCDKRLMSLSQQPEIILESPYFELMSSVLEDHNESNKSLGYVDLKMGIKSSLQGPHHHVLPSTPLASNISTVRTQGSILLENFPPCTAISTQAAETNASTSKPENLSTSPRQWDQIKVPGLNSSMSMSDLVNHLGNCISGKTTPGAPLFEVDSSLNKSTLEDITQKLLEDSQFNSATDEKTLMARINSLCCLIQQEEDGKDNTKHDEDNAADDRGNNNSKEEEPVMLMNLPRIQSMPQFLCNIRKGRGN